MTFKTFLFTIGFIVAVVVLATWTQLATGEWTP